MLVLVGWLIARFFNGVATWRVAGGYALAIALAVSIVCGLNYLLAGVLNVVDSSHGFMAVGLPVVIGVIGGVIAVMALLFGALRAGIREEVSAEASNPSFKRTPDGAA